MSMDIIMHQRFLERKEKASKMTNEEIRQKAIECGKADLEFCSEHHCDDCCLIDVNPCNHVMAYEHGFEDGVKEERRRIFEEYWKAVKADSEASMHGDMFPKNVERFWQEMKGE